MSLCSSRQSWEQSTNTDAFLWSFDHSLQPTSHALASCGKTDPIGIVGHQTGGSSEAFTSWQQPCHEPFGLLGASFGCEQSPPCRTLSHPWRLHPWAQLASENSLGFRPACQQPRPTFCTTRRVPFGWWNIGPRQHVQGIPWYSLGRRWTCWRWFHQEAWSWGFLVTCWWSLHPLGGCMGWVANCSAALSCTKSPSVPWGFWGWHSFWCAARVWYPAQVFWRKILAELIGTKPLSWCLKTLQRAKVLVLDSCFYRFCTYSQLVGLVLFFQLEKCTAERKQGLNSKCPKCFAGEGSSKWRVVLPLQSMGSTLEQLSWENYELSFTV